MPERTAAEKEANKLSQRRSRENKKSNKTKAQVELENAKRMAATWQNKSENSDKWAATCQEQSQNIFLLYERLYGKHMKVLAEQAGDQEKIKELRRNIGDHGLTDTTLCFPNMSPPPECHSLPVIQMGVEASQLTQQMRLAAPLPIVQQPMSSNNYLLVNQDVSQQIENGRRLMYLNSPIPVNQGSSQQMGVATGHRFIQPKPAPLPTVQQPMSSNNSLPVTQNGSQQMEPASGSENAQPQYASPQLIQQPMYVAGPLAGNNTGTPNWKPIQQEVPPPQYPVAYMQFHLQVPGPMQFNNGQHSMGLDESHNSDAFPTSFAAEINQDVLDYAAEHN